MAVNISAHGIERITTDLIEHFPATVGRGGFYSTRITIKMANESFIMDLFAPTREALRVMQDELARPIDEVTR